MEKKALLTIIIPTYNRKNQIQRQVEQIFPQLSDEVRLIVVDNCSEYDIYSLFPEDKKRRFDIRINKFNIGGDANIAKSFELCETKWLWTLSDDDKLSVDAVSKVLDVIKNNPNCIYINFNKRETVVTHNLSEFLNVGKYCYSDLFWMSICIYNMEILRNYMHFYFPYISSMQPGIHLLLNVLNTGNKDVLFSNVNIIDVGDKSISWNRTSFIISSLFLIDLIRKIKNVERTFVPSIVGVCYSNTLVKYRKDRKLWEAISMYKRIMKRVGLGSLLKYNLKQTLRILIKFFGHVLFKYKN